MAYGALQSRIRVIAGGAILSIVLLVTSCAGVPGVPAPAEAPERLDLIGTALEEIGEIAANGSVSEVLLLDLTGEAREPLLGLLAVPDRLARRLDRACLVESSDHQRTIWLEGRLGLVAVSVAMAIEGYPRTGDRRWLIPGGDLVHESRGVLRVDLSDTVEVSGEVSLHEFHSDRRGRAIFDRWRLESPDLVLALLTTDRGQLPLDLKEAQAPFLPEELLAIAWSVPEGVELAVRSKFATDRTARVALVATRLGARRTIDRFALIATESFAIDRRGAEIDMMGVVAPWESLWTVAAMIEGGDW